MTTAPKAPPADPRLDRPRLVAFVVALAALVATTNQTLVVPLLLQLPAQLSVSTATASWLVTAPVIAGAVAHPLLGRLGDQFGLRRMLLLALGALVVGSALCAVTDRIELLIAGRALQGVSSAVISLGMSLLGSVLGAERRRAAVATVSAMLGVGGALGLPAAGVIAQLGGFHGLFVVSGVAGLLAVASIVALVPAPPPAASGTRVDVLGAALLTAATVGLLVALDRGAEWGWASPAVLGTLAGAAVAAALFATVQLRRPEPLVDLRLAGERSSLAVTVAAVLVGVGLFVNFLGVVGRLQAPPGTGYGYGLSVLETGLLLLPSGILGALAAPASSRLADRIGSRLTSVLGCVLLLLGLLGVLLVGAQGVVALLVATALAGVGSSVVLAGLPALIMAISPVHRIGAANGLNSLARAVGMSVGSTLFGVVAVVAAAAGGAVSQAGMDAFAGVGCGVALGAALALLVARERGPGGS
jgi:predicted MFS family arabinose efflux permease